VIERIKGYEATLAWVKPSGAMIVEEETGLED
jgi:hypothetical protein